MTSVACSRTESAAIWVIASSARPSAPASRLRRIGASHLLDQPDLAVGRGLERAEVARLDAVLRQLGDRPGDDDGVVVVRRRARPRDDEPEALELGQQLLVDLGRGEQLAAGEPQPGGVGVEAVARTGSRRRPAPAAAPAGPR